MAINHDVAEDAKKSKQPRQLNEDKEMPIFQLNEIEYLYNNGAESDYRLLSALFGMHDVAIYEAVSGNDRYPPGRNMNVRLSYEELEKLIEGYKATKTERKRLEAERKAKSASDDDFDPFLDSDDLP